MSKVFFVNNKKFVGQYGVQTCLDPICLDIETSHNKEQTLTWIVSIQVLFGDDYYLFRTGEELCNWYLEVIKQYKLGFNGKNTRRIINYIHNASYDLSYLIPFFRAYLPRDEETDKGTLILDSHSILQYAQAGFLWRCSYKLSNRSLESWGKALNIPHKKKVGLYDYDAVLFPDSELTEEQQAYDKFDVVSLQECLKKQMLLNREALAPHDNYRQLPLTSTGYVRRDLSESCLSSEEYMQKIFRTSKLTGELYHACVCAYSGGYTHNNRFMKDLLIEAGKEYFVHGKKIFVKNMAHRDFKSHYPTQMIKNVYPLGKWSCIYDFEIAQKQITIDEVLSFYPDYSSMVWLRIASADIKSEDITMPFLQVCKLLFDKDDCKYMVADNGRVLYMKAVNDRYFEIYLDNVTLSIINEQYNLDYEILKVWRCPNKKLPVELTSVINKYFKGKSDKKNELKESIKLYGELSQKSLDLSAELQLLKALLNACYGCTCTRPVRDDWEIDPQTLEFRLKSINKSTMTKEEIARNNYEREILGIDAFYENKKSFLPFQIGIWVCAYARKELFDFVKIIGYDKILYCDTDSAFYITDDKTEKAIEYYNKQLHKKAPFVVLNNGNNEYYDHFELESYIKGFKGLHAKCYGYVNDFYELLITIAGVPRRTITGMKNGQPIYLTREDELRFYDKGVKVCNECSVMDGLDKLTNGYTFYINTATTAKYLYTENGQIETHYIDGHKITTGGGCVISKGKTKTIKPFEIKFVGDYV